jgi:amino acid transporter
VSDNQPIHDRKALAILASSRPRNIGWFQAAGLLFGDWGTSRLYVLGLSFVVAGTSSFVLVAAMSVLIMAVAWAYTQICRIFPEGGGVYTAARQKSAVLGVVGAMLLFADYTVTASLSSMEAFHYFGLGDHSKTELVVSTPAGNDIRLYADRQAQAQAQALAHPEVVEPQVAHPPLPWWNSPGLWGMVAIVIIGGLNLLGPKHVAGLAIAAAAGMIAITLLLVCFALPQINWSTLDLGHLNHQPLNLWQAFVAIVLALSGVEAIANLTGVMKKPVGVTSRRAIWIVAAEVAVFNLVLAVIMCSVEGLGREEHKEDMLAFLAGHYVGPWGEWMVRIIGGLLLLSAANTAIGALLGTVYVMSRDGELPSFFQKLNAFGTPWVAAILATLVPASVLIFAHDLETLAHLYAIGIVGAVAINCAITTFHPRLRKNWRRISMGLLALLLIFVWITLAVTKLHALLFVTIILVGGLAARAFTKWRAQRNPRPSLLRQAIIEQLTPEALGRPKYLLATAGGTQLAEPALQAARAGGATLVVCFVREIALSYKVDEKRLTLDTDPAAEDLFITFLRLGHSYSVPIIPTYDIGPNSAEMIAETAAMNGVEKVFIGTSRRGSLHQIIKGSFQRRLEGLLPPDTRVTVLSPVVTVDAAPATRS